MYILKTSSHECNTLRCVIISLEKNEKRNRSTRAEIDRAVGWKRPLQVVLRIHTHNFTYIGCHFLSLFFHELWKDEYFGPVVEGLDAIKGVARPGADLLRDFKNDFFANFNVEKEYKDFEKIIEEQKKEEQNENKEGPKPNGKLPATVAAAIFLSGVSHNLVKKTILILAKNYS